MAGHASTRDAAGLGSRLAAADPEVDFWRLGAVGVTPRMYASVDFIVK
ncbi:MAG: hypothetical protein Q8P41_25150 [Pseudomonadota bacterium]|nr:hypothetical protein [Pseudomonadota bacterium]